MASITPSAYKKLTNFALVSLALIIVTGATVRLTGSGLGCSDWPTCEENQLIADLEFHPMIEFINRLVTGLVSIAAIVAVLGSMRRTPRRGDLTRWSWGLVVGVIAQIVIGMFVVRLELDPRLVLLHFLVSMVLIWNAVVLHHRASLPDTLFETISETMSETMSEARSDRTNHTVVTDVQHLIWPARAITFAAAYVISVGTLVTGSGPHTGSERASGEPVERLPFAIRAITQAHSIGVIVLLITVLFTVWLARRNGVFALLQKELGELLGVIVFQGAIGYTQYFTGVPALLVGVHIVGSILVWVTVLRLHLRVGWGAPGHLPSPPRRVVAQTA